MKRLRLATPEEIDKIRQESDLDNSCTVIALDTQDGVALAVVRMPVEVDPVYFPETFSPKLKAFFMRDVETYLAARGASSYYFNIVETPDNEDWKSVVQNWGAEQVSKAPEVRFKKVL